MLARAGVVVLCAVVLAAGLWTGELVRNEGLRARLAAEAWQSGTWLVPSLHGEPHLTKPPGMGVLIGLCSLPAGRVTPLTARLPSVLAGATAVVLVALTFRSLLGGQAALIAAAILPCSFLWLDRVPSAEIDLIQLAWVTAALLCLLRASQDEGSSLPWLLALACVSGGFFTKWTAPAFFYLTALTYLSWRGQLRLLWTPGHLAGLILFAALALGWLILAGHSAGWQTLSDTLGREALLRFSPGHHPRPYPWDELATFPLGFLAANLPWSLCLVVACRPAFARLWDERTRALWQLALVWLATSLAFWTVAPGHRPRHLLPAQPAVAILAALVWTAWLTGRLSWPVPRFGPRPVLTALFCFFLVVKLVWVSQVVPERTRQRGPAHSAAQLAALVPADAVLYLHRFKDEGLLFYYGRTARRLHDPDALPVGAWCLLTEAEWHRWRLPASVHGRLCDSQGAAIVLVRREG